ncbi:unnamed protein product [Arctogadus glacialis]
MGSTNQSSKVTDSSEAKRDEDEQSKMASATAVGENNTTVQATEEEYFQFQGVTERSQEADDAMLDSTEISAIADYARLKVIAAEDEPDPIQEFPPNKKEGFFPMIQSRHSRRPVFTAETPERRTVSKKTVSREPEPSPKVEKEPKCLVFSTMEQDHKRTGMFKLREKENVLSDVKTKDKADDDKMHTQDPTGTPRAGSEDFQYWSRDTAKPAGPTLSSSANINQTNTSSSQHSAQPDNSTTTERPQGGAVFTEPRTGPQVDHNSHQQAMFGKMFNKGKNRGDGSNAIVSEAKSKENEEATAAKQRQENKIIQQINEERRATLEAQKREARRAREREARAARIEKDRRETQREAERMAEEERRETQREAERIAEVERTAQLLKEKAAQEEMEKKREEENRVVEEEWRKKRREEERRKKETEERIAAQIQEEMRRAKRREEEERRALEEEARAAKEVEDKRRDRRREEDRRVAQIQEERRAAQVEEQRREREEERREREEQRREREEEMAREGGGDGPSGGREEGETPRDRTEDKGARGEESCQAGGGQNEQEAGRGSQAAGKTRRNQRGGRAACSDGGRATCPTGGA